MRSNDEELEQKVLPKDCATKAMTGEKYKAYMTNMNVVKSSNDLIYVRSSTFSKPSLSLERDMLNDEIHHLKKNPSVLVEQELRQQKNLCS